MAIMTHEEAAACEDAILLCNTIDRHSPFDDNEYGNCTKCGTDIYWRPHNPPNLKRVCVACGLAMAKEAEDPIWAATDTTVEEVRRVLADD